MAEGGALLRRYTGLNRYRGFESLSLRQPPFTMTNPQAQAGLVVPSIDNDVKMVIWDLDDTFWNGTLSEEGVAVVEASAMAVRALAARGIVSSIASKNDFEAAKDVLEHAGVWEYFVFPSISFDAKGKKVAEIISAASLRAENVLFIDDNLGNLGEARFYNPGIMLARPGEIPRLLEHPRLAGKPDLELKRLRQYRVLQRKFADQSSAGVSK